jgi:uncharacterized protein YyaL (SSP411 family)
LITPHFEVEDNVIPAANSVIANVLFKLSIYFENSYFEKISRQMLQHILPTIDYPSSFSNWLNLLLNFSEQQKEIAICGEKAIEFGTKINQYYLPNAIIAGRLANYVYINTDQAVMQGINAAKSAMKMVNNV